MKKKFLSLKEKAIKKSTELCFALQELGRVASEILNKEVVADICNGEEIEFREVDQYGIADAYSCITIEDILNKIKE